MPGQTREVLTPTAEALLEAMSEGVYAVDPERRITYWNSAAEQLTGYQAEEVVGQLCRGNLLNHVDDAGTQLCRADCPLVLTMRDGQAREARLFLHHRAGHRVPVAVRVAALRSPDGAMVGAVAVFHDDSGYRAVTERLEVAEREADTDALTGIANRRMLQRAIELRRYEHQRYQRCYAVIFVDVDDFKHVNERYGHDVGDEVLRLVAATLRRFTRPSDTAGRWGGDEFLLVAPVTDRDHAVAMAERCRRLVASSCALHDQDRVAVTVTAGVAVARPDESSRELVNRASLAMLDAKS
jgi:diguanylate cyclase (GGDEF)-like protein/PAS domain S-box-containing protein